MNGFAEKYVPNGKDMFFIYAAGNQKMDKEKSTEKIDGAVATVMALDRAIRCGNDNHESVYEERGIFII